MISERKTIEELLSWEKSSRVEEYMKEIKIEELRESINTFENSIARISYWLIKTKQDLEELENDN